MTPESLVDSLTPTQALTALRSLAVYAATDWSAGEALFHALADAFDAPVVVGGEWETTRRAVEARTL